MSQAGWALLWPGAIGFAAVARARGWLYENGALPSYAVDRPVVSVGNVTAGGTGKTPIVEALARGLAARGRRPAIVSRGYGGSERGPARAPAGGPGSGAAAARFGDEPTWLARALPDVPVIVGRDRVAAARMALAEGAGCVIADDAFQHRRLRRDVDVVVIDATEPLWHYWPLPAGRAREPLAALSRARAIVLNKVNLVSEARLAEARELVRRSGATASVVECAYRIRALAALGAEGAEEPIASARGARVFCATGLGRPAGFRAALLAAEPGVQIVGSIDFPDHRAYSANDFARIEAEAKAAGAEAIVVSEKDAVKMDGWRPALPAKVTRLRAEPARGWDEWHDQIDRLLF